MGALRRTTQQQWAPDSGVAPARDLFVPIPDGFRTEAGDALEDRSVRLRLYGDLAQPLVLVAGGVSSGRFVADGGETGRGWWSESVCSGGGVDLDRFGVLGLDFAPHAPSRSLTITTADQARLIALALDGLGVERLHGFVGASYGGMVALAFAALFPHRVERLCVISAAHRADPMTTALRGVQRRILRFAEASGRPEEGISLARQLALTTYRTAEEVRARFDEPAPSAAGEPYAVCSYLVSQGRRYHETMHAGRWVAMSDSMDRHRVDPAAVRARTTLVGVTSDRLVPIEDMRALVAALPDGSLFELPSLYGHDAFLKEAEALAPVLRSSLEEQAA